MGLPQIKGSFNYQRNLKLPASLVPSNAFGFPPIIPLATGDTLFVDQTPDPNAPEFQELVFGTKNNMTAGLEVSQLVFDGSYLLGLEAARKFVYRAEQQVQRSEAEVRHAVAEAYLGVLVIDENLNILKDNESLLNKILFETTQLYENGFIEALDVDRLKLSLSNLQTRIEDANYSKELATNALKFQMGMPLTENIKAADTFEQHVEMARDMELADLGALQKNAVSNRIEMQLLETQNIFRELDISQVKKQYLPNVAVFAAAQTSFQSDNFKLFNTDLWIPSALVGLQVNIPIFDGLQKRGQLDQRLVMQKQAFNDQSLMEQAIGLEVLQARTNYLKALKQVEDREENVALAQKIYDITLIKYKEGLGSSLEVTNAESALYETQGLYIGALYDLALAKIAMDKALGNYND